MRPSDIGDGHYRLTVDVESPTTDGRTRSWWTACKVYPAGSRVKVVGCGLAGQAFGGPELKDSCPVTSRWFTAVAEHLEPVEDARSVLDEVDDEIGLFEYEVLNLMLERKAITMDDIGEAVLILVEQRKSCRREG